ncbi:MAG TPA: peptidoglycan DD-metalloendopeptidase family protein [Desulfatiglandales bacterium]|nr:peptidoglycan DD-metalloendopeptidase family protein [Desulfatiglandales bacterium]
MNQIVKGFLPLFFILCAIIFIFFFLDFLRAEERSSIESNNSQIQQVGKDLLEQQGELLSVDIKEKGILGEIERLEREVVIHKRSLKELSSRIKEISYEIKGGQKRIQRLDESSSAARTYLKKRLIAFYKFGRSGYVWLLASSATLQEFQKTIKYMKAIMAQDRQVLDILDMQMRQVESELSRLKENVAKVEELKKVKNSRMALLEKYIEKKVFLLMKTHREKEFYAKAVEELKEATRALSETMMHLETKEKESMLPESFAKMKGKLPLPLKGKILRDVKQFGFNPFMHRKGIYITGSPGEAVRSVFPGRIDYSGWFKGYGQLLIIDHGYHYFTVFAHLEEIVKEKGEAVSGGEVIGVIGDPGWQVGPGVYFEIRRGGNHLDPKRWLQ